jgi:hypothetical protein
LITEKGAVLLINNSIYQSAKAHFKNNTGSMYVWLLVFAAFCMCVMSGILMTAKTNIAVNSINNEIEIASDYVMADYKKQDYSQWSEGMSTGLRDGTLIEPGAETTPYTTNFNAYEFARRLAAELNNLNTTALIDYDASSNTITRYVQEKSDDAMAYQIRVNSADSVNGKLTVNFTVHIYEKMVGIDGFEDVQTYTKSTQLHLKDYKMLPKLEAQLNSSTVIARASDGVSGNFIYGLREYIRENVFLNNYVKATNDGRIEIVYAPNGLGGSWNYVGTGTVVNVYDRNGTSDISDDILAETFEVVIFGDIDGDSCITAVDGTVVSDEADGMTNWSRKDSSEYSATKTLAADVNHDGVITREDAQMVYEHAISGGIVQSP